MAEPTLTLDEASALLDRLDAEEAAKKKKKEPTTIEKIKDLIVEGAQQGRGGLNAGASRQLDVLEEEGY